MTTVLLIVIAGLIWYIWHQGKAKQQEKEEEEVVPLRFTMETSYSSNPEPAAAADKDAWDPVPDEHYEPTAKRRKLQGITLHIRFQDLEGKVTERDVSPFWYAHESATGNGLMYAFCHMRQGNRPFSLKRIQAATDISTGEIISNLGQWLDDAYSQTTEGAVEQFLDRHSAAVYVLFCFAKADGAMRVKERNAIATWAQTEGLSSATDVATLEKQMKNWTATDHAFWDAVKQLANEGRSAYYMGCLWEAVVNIVKSDKTPSEQEIKYLRYAAEKLSQPMPIFKTSNAKTGATL